MRPFCVLILVVALAGCESKQSAQGEQVAPPAEAAPAQNPKSRVGKANKKLRTLKKNMQGTMDAREGNLDQKIDSDK